MARETRDARAAIAQSASFRDGIQKLSERLQRPPEEIRHEALAGVGEMEARHAAAPQWAWRRLGRSLLRNYELHVDERALKQLRELDRTHTLVWLPSHRSYLDTWAVPAALDACGFPPYYVMGGINLDFWPFGDLARRTGLVFIRRSVRDDPVYRFALRQYLAYLVSQHADFGWSIEGGRTRTGKLRPPRYGLLRYLADAVRESGARDVLLVPVSVIYDQLPEVEVMAAEASGAAKRPEDIRWLVDFARRQRGGGGGVYIDVGEPLDLADRLAELGGDPNGHGHEVERVGLDVCHRINRATPIVPGAAVTIALLAADRALTLEEIVGAVAPLNVYFSQRGFPIAASSRLDHPALVLRTLDQLADAGAVVRFDAGREPVWSIGPEQHLVAAFYRNSAVHFLVERAVAELARLRSRDADGSAPSVGWDEALRLRELLKFEFFFPQKQGFLDDMRLEMAVLDEAPGAMPLAPAVLRPFLEAYLVVADCLAAMNPGHRLDERAFLGECLGVGRQWLLQRRLTSAESVSLELFRTGLALARHRGLEGPGGTDLEQARQEFLTELRDTIALLASAQSTQPPDAPYTMSEYSDRQRAVVAEER
jgi:glycerol-3-phosphate O-acyltransferase